MADALWWAAEYGHANIVERLFHYQVDPNLLGEAGSLIRLMFSQLIGGRGQLLDELSQKNKHAYLPIPIKAYTEYQ